MSSPKLRQVINRLALEVDPEKARLQELARELEVHPRTVWAWTKAGRMSTLRAKDINRRFGDALAPMKVLIGRKS